MHYRQEEIQIPLVDFMLNMRIKLSTNATGTRSSVREAIVHVAYVSRLKVTSDND